ncbi:FecR family protein [Rhodoferax aquaticus]|uniref:FecR protein domain-containing protein n=1 Tax=Rhodoferax aquaticus TaxID=2527691 RepID=A0A515EUH1_9BURK|nr:FecR domain-containing protein [Rhodoferax aquaticus]QDL56278.1 hypothetical protein EXZ61_20135 [Rhodoferax aquaticus]
MLSLHRVFGIATVLLLSASLVQAQTTAAANTLPAGAVGIVTNLQGSLNTGKPGTATRPLAVNATVKEGDVLNTGAGTFARLKMVDGAELVLRPNSQAEITQYSYKPNAPTADNALITLVRGGLRSITGLLGKRNPQQVSFKTATATVGIRGTIVGIQQCNNDCTGLLPSDAPPNTPPPPNGTHVEVIQGLVALNSGGAQLLLGAGSFGLSRTANTAPQAVARNQALQQNIPASIFRDTTSSTSGTNSNAQVPSTTDATTPSTLLATEQTVTSSTEVGTNVSNLPAPAAGLQNQAPAPVANNVVVFPPSFSPNRSASTSGGGRSAASPN